MPSGRTHDRITLWSLPLTAGLTYAVTEEWGCTLIVSGGFLFGGLMFGPDLDIHSVQYKRWGWLRWIWLPYRASMTHRSSLSHGPLLGTALRVLYLFLWLGFLGMLIVGLMNLLGVTALTHAVLGDAVERSLQQHAAEWIALLVGVELGALSHSLSDWTGSTYKRVRKHGWSALRSKKASKKHTSRPSPPSARSRKGARSRSNRPSQSHTKR